MWWCYFSPPLSRAVWASSEVWLDQTFFLLKGVATLWIKHPGGKNVLIPCRINQVHRTKNHRLLGLYFAFVGREKSYPLTMRRPFGILYF